MGKWVYRPRNHEWQVYQANTGGYGPEAVNQSILLDIREYLRQLVTIFQCSNARAIPQILREIQANTKRPKRKRKRS